MFDQNLIEKYKWFNWNLLLRKDMWEFSLEEASPIFARIKKFFDSIISNPELENLAQGILNEIDTQIRSFFELYDRHIVTYQNTSDKQQIIELIKNKEFEIINVLWKYTAYLRELDPKKDKEYKSYTEDAKKKILEIDQNLSQISKLSERAKQVAQKEEIALFWTFFWVTADKNKKSANLSFWIMIVLVFFTWVIAWLFLGNISFLQDSKISFLNNVLKTITSQGIFEKIVIISLLGYIVSHFSRRYSAERHLYVLNIHRQNALNSHKQIIDSVQSTSSESDLETKNAILLQITKAIFENQETWYLKDSWSSPIISNQILEASKILTSK